jgi:dienelactone hydrolase
MNKILLFFGLFLAAPTFAQNTRYLNRVFTGVTKTANIVYGNAPAINSPYLLESSTTNVDLTLDLFQPMGDNALFRRVIVFIHSGGFLNGSKENEDMQALCDSFARRGYVTVSINYRKGFNVLSANASERGVYRGLQDAAAAIRYLRQFRTTYKIDTSSIFAMGSSAGGFSAINLAYMDNSERPASTFAAFLRPDLGCIDCAGNSYTHSHQVKAIANCWGAIGNTNWINASNNNVPAILFHGDLDGSVPYNIGPPFGFPIFPDVYGSLPIDQRLTNQNIVHEFNTGLSEDHEYWGTSNGQFSPAPTPFYLDIINKTALFFYNQLPAPPLPVELMSFAANKSRDGVALTWETGLERNACCFEIEHSTDGLTFKTIGTVTAKGDTDKGDKYQFEDTNTAAGVHYYRLKPLDRDGEFTYSTIVQVQWSDDSFSIYPNPTSSVFYISHLNSEETGTVTITNTLGEQVWSGSLSAGTFDLSSQNKGIYIVTIQTESQAVTRQIFLK